MNQPITEVIRAANGRWPQVFTSLGIDTPKHGRHGPCPVCGGKDRFRFDNKEGRGTWFCNQCDTRAGDGLSLVANVTQLTLSEAAKQVAGTLGLELGKLSVEVVTENKQKSKALRQHELEKSKKRSKPDKRKSPLR